MLDLEALLSNNTYNFLKITFILRNEKSLIKISLHVFPSKQYEHLI